MQRRSLLYGVLLLGGLLIPSFLFAGRAPGQGPGGRQRRQLSPEEIQRMREKFRQARLERLKEQLGFSDEEWKAVSKLVQQVEEKRAAFREARFFFGFRGRGRGRGPGGGRPRFEPQTELGKARVKLQEVIQKESASSSEIKSALKAYKKAYSKAQTELKQAQCKLLEVLTPKQEAIAILNGLIDPDLNCK